jgi:hypothetical protein
MKTWKVVACAVITAIAMPAVSFAADGASKYAPGHLQKHPGQAKQYAPGHLKKHPGEAKRYAPGHQMQLNCRSLTGSAPTLAGTRRHLLR